jgi:hypothetical protein
LKSLSLLGQREARHDPDDKTQEVHDRSNIHERDTESLRPEVHDLETGSFSFSSGEARVARRRTSLRPQEELGQFTERVRADLL